MLPRQPGGGGVLLLRRLRSRRPFPQRRPSRGRQPAVRQSPFVFPTGRQCRNFNELAVACVEEWDSARDLLCQGYLETFLGGLGRIDLVMAAKEAAKFPDHDRGLDQFLNKLPSETLGEPKLTVETQEINLGVVPVGSDASSRFISKIRGYASFTAPSPVPTRPLADSGRRARHHGQIDSVQS